MELSRTFGFEAAHLLPNVPDGHKCRRLHGHSYRVTVTVAGEVDALAGWVVDFAELEDAWRPLHEALDHRYLNDVEGLDNPTSELLAMWIWERLTGGLDDRAALTAVEVAETCTSRCVYRGG
jgi:6-pyruvoyltetrahydropterin/6-carboxytetrahydropterin synthase